MEEWRRVVAVPQREAEAVALALDDLTAEREQVESAADVIDATSEFMERLTALRAAVAGEVIGAEGIAATQVALRRVFDADGRGELRPRAAAPRGRQAGHVPGWNPGGYLLAAVSGAGQLTPVPPRPQ